VVEQNGKKVLSDKERREVKLGSPQLFLISIGVGPSLETKTIKAASWQDAVIEVAKQNFAECGQIVPALDLVPDMQKIYPTINSLASVMWARTQASLSIGILRPAIYSIDTGYKDSDYGPIANTGVNVIAEYLPLDYGTVYVP